MRKLSDYLSITKGDPGVLIFLMDAYDKSLSMAEFGFQRMRDAGITGPELYILWNDHCNRDTKMAMSIMINEEINKIIHYIDRNERM